MGLFSGSFGTGLVKGLATSVDASLKSAMEKRDKEMSRARTFWQTRQAQKMDAAEAKDERAGDALTRLIEEFNGDVAKGIATYKGLGGSLDSVESFIKEIDDTRNAGMSYNLDDKVKFEGIDLSQFADLSYEDAFSTIRTEVKPLDIQMSDMSGLSKIGLGIDNMGQQVSKGVNELIPARTKTNISGLTGAFVRTLLSTVQQASCLKALVERCLLPKQVHLLALLLMQVHKVLKQHQSGLEVHQPLPLHPQ